MAAADDDPGCSEESESEGGGESEGSSDAAAWRGRGPEDAELARRTFERYYRAQGVVPEAEWPLLEEALARQLPLCFRVNRSVDPDARCVPALRVALRLAAERLAAARGRPPREDELARGVSRYQRGGDAGGACDAPGGDASGLLVPELARVPWLRDAWCVRFQEAHQWRNSYAGQSAPAHLRPVLEWLIVRQAAGEVSRQEMVSMLPAALLGVRPGERVLDMCGAPGSKASQVLDALVGGVADHTGMADHTDVAVANAASLLVCNEIAPKRAKRLCQRLGLQPSGPLLVTTCDAARLPALKAVTRLEGGLWREERLRFQKIICDVPCSGDGAARKHPDVLDGWRSSRAADLHRKQCAILQRGLQLLEPGGLLAYSTCSLNPLEGEAVVAEALRRDWAARGAAELVEPPALPGLSFSRGLGSWHAPGSPALGPGAPRGRARRSLLPPREGEEFGLHRCVRVLPHQNDSGGFFCALLRKPPRPSREPGPPAAGGAAGGTEKGLREDGRKPPVIHRIFRSVPPTWRACAEVAGLFGLQLDAEGAAARCVRRFPWELVAMARKGPCVLLLLSSERLRGMQDSRRFGVASAGTPLFRHMGTTDGAWPAASSPWRPCHEAAGLLAECATERVWRLPPAVFARCARSARPLLALAEDPELAAAAPGELHSWGSGAVLLAPHRTRPAKSGAARVPSLVALLRRGASCGGETLQLLAGRDARLRRAQQCEDGEW